MIDIHSHILPGLDDGSDDWGQSFRMAENAARDGIRGIICTPHWSPAFPNNDRNRILENFAQFRERVQEEGIPISVFPGCELVIDFGLPERIEAGEALTVNDERRFALIETPHEFIPPNVEHFFWMLQVKGITPILGHPERNRQILKDQSRLVSWVESGVLVQITAGSIIGHFGKPVRQLSAEMLRRNLVHFVASDSHSCDGKRHPGLSQCRDLTAGIIGEEETEKIFCANPSCILRGVLPDILEPLPPQAKRPSLFARLLHFR